MRRILALLILLAIPAVAQFGGPMGGMRPGSMQGGGLLPGRGGDPLWVAAGPTKPTLDFDFAKRKDLTDAVSGKTSLVNFSRSAAQSPGTYVGADGLIHDAAVNLALYSEQFDNAAFLKLGSGAAAPIVTANQTTAPDGKQTAEKIVLPAVSATNNYSIILRTQSGAAAGAYTYSVYLRGNVGGETIYLTLSNAAPSTSKECVLTTSWQRCSIDYVNPGGTIYANFGVDLRDPTESAQPAQTVFAWGAQLEETDPATMQPTAYIKTTSQALAAPRFDHDPVTGESLGLLVEEARANLISASENMASATWVKRGFDAAVDLGPTGPLGAQAWRFDENNTDSNAAIYWSNDVTDGTPRVFSVWLRASINDSIALSTQANVKTADVSLTDQWQKFYVTDSQDAVIGPHIGGFSTITRGSGISIYVAMPQQEAGSFPTSYIPTTGSSQTRYADVAAVQDEDFSTTNLLAYSESFDVGWTKTADVSFSANAIVSPDGQTTAEKFEFSGSSIKRIYQTGLPLTVGVFSVYAKAGEETTFSLWTNAASRVTIFDLSSASVVSSNATWSSIKPVGDGWYLCQHYYGGSATSDVNIYGRNGSGAGFTPASNGDGLYFWGASLTATEYPVEYVTTRNLLTDSQDFERSSWAALVAGGAAAPVINNDFGQAPDGTNTADKIDFGDTSDPAKYSLVRNIASNLVIGKIYRASIYAKAATASDVGKKIYFYFESVIHEFTLTSEWQRLEFWNAAGAASRFFIVGARGSNTPQPAFSALLWGAQMEPVPDIVTTATDYVRTVDVVGKDYQWYEPTEGTVFVEAQPSPSSWGGMFWFNRDSAAARGWSMNSQTPTSVSTAFRGDDASLKNLLLGSVSAGSFFRGSAFLDYSQIGGALNGTLASPLSMTSSYQVNRMDIGFQYSAGPNSHLNGHIRRLTYWPRRQADSTLQVITQ